MNGYSPILTFGTAGEAVPAEGAADTQGGALRLMASNLIAMASNLL